ASDRLPGRAPDRDTCARRRYACSASFALMLCVSAMASAQTPPAELRKVAEDKAVNLCSTCHGPRGVSVSPEFPILAAQRKGYLANQIEAFRKRTRTEKDAHDFM